MENKKGVFRNWSWKRFILDAIFFLLFATIFTFLIRMIDFFKTEHTFIEEIKHQIFQAVFMSFIFTMWDDSKRDAIIIYFTKNYFINEFKYTPRSFITI
jgi:uncharacterized protein YpmS